MTVWDCVMYRDEADMFDCRLEAFKGQDGIHVVTEARFTHRGVPKPLNFDVDLDLGYPISYVVDEWQPDPDPWVNEHHQRNAAWKVIAAEAADTDTVLICDLDEIPSPGLLAFAARWGTEGPGGPVSVPMRTFMFAVDWEAIRDARGRALPPTCVLASVRWLRGCAGSGAYLAEVRDGRDRYMQYANRDDPADKGGWHFSWVGGPQRQREKLETASCHAEEILATPEGELIRSGARWRSAADGGGIPVRPVDVDETWPAYVRERRCPPEWFRPRSSEEAP